MKKVFVVLTLGATLLMTSCGSYTGNGSLIGTGGGAALGALVGGLIGGGKGAAIGSAVGGAVGAGAGAAIGHHMDKKKAALEAELANQATVETVTDSQGLTAIKVTFNADMTFAKNSSNLSASAKTALAGFANQMTATDMLATAIQIKGHTDSSGGDAINQPLSEKRAKAVGDVLRAGNVTANRITEVGLASSEPCTANAADAANRRVEVFILATDEMVRQAEAGKL